MAHSSYVEQFRNFSILITLLNIISISALFEDQVGKFDWKKEFIGPPEYVAFYPEYRKLIVATNNNVLSSINPVTGEIGWRQVHEIGDAGKIETLLRSKDDLLTLSAGGLVIRSWDINTGFLNWEVPVTNSDTQNVVASVHQLLPEQLLTVEIVPDFSIHVSYYNTSSGQLVNHFKIPVSWSYKNVQCQFVNSKLLACIDHAASYLYVVTVKEGETFIITPLSSLLLNIPWKSIEIMEIPGLTSKSDNLFALRIDRRHHKILTIEEDSVKVLHDLPDTVAVDIIDTSEGLLMFTLSGSIGSRGHLSFMVSNIKTKESLLSVMDDIELASNHGNPEKMWVFSIPKKEGGSAYRVLFVFEDHAVVFLQNSGKILWTREEALASVVNVEIVELPLSESDAHFEQEFRIRDGNVFSMLTKRLTTQLFQLETFFTSILNGFQISDRSEKTLQLTRDEFDLHKLIILVTKPGKIFGVDSLSGNIVWQFFIDLIEPFNAKDGDKLILFIQRTTAYFPHHPQCVIVGKNKINGKGLLYPFHPISGMPLNDKPVELNFEIAQALLLPQADKDYLRPLLLMDKEQKIHVYPTSGMTVAKQLSKTLFLFTVDVDKGDLNGLSLAYSTAKELLAVPVWKIHFPPSSQAIIQVVGKRPNEHVHSQGRVMGDRSVMYKYLNPNLVAVFTRGTDNHLKSFFNIFLLDVVTGSIVYSATHKRCREPLHIVHSENWIVYTYYSDKSRRTEMAVLELYEGKSQSNSTAFSSLNPSTIPIVEHQAYIFAPGLTSAAATITEKGITNKFLLFALPSGKILELPKALLDPRRSIIPTQEHREEGIYPYAPELPIPSENIINYNQSINHVRGIYTAPAGLESTCLVLAYGLDLFFTRVTPSRTFDVLKDDFDHCLISAVLLALVAASYFTRRLAARKALQQAWK